MSGRLAVGDGCVVSIAYKLTDEGGTVIDASDREEPLTYLHGRQKILPALERTLAGKQAGDTERFSVSPTDGYGEHDPAKIVTLPRERFDFEVFEGQVLSAELPDGRSLVFQVVAVTDAGVTLDGNHPLAGRHLNFEVTVVDVRPATEEELDHGHAHL